MGNIQEKKRENMWKQLEERRNWPYRIQIIFNGNTARLLDQLKSLQLYQDIYLILVLEKGRTYFFAKLLNKKYFYYVFDNTKSPHIEVLIKGDELQEFLDDGNSIKIAFEPKDIDYMKIPLELIQDLNANDETERKKRDTLALNIFLKKMVKSFNKNDEFRSEYVKYNQNFQYWPYIPLEKFTRSLYYGDLVELWMVPIHGVEGTKTQFLLRIPVFIAGEIPDLFDIFKLPTFVQNEGLNFNKLADFSFCQIDFWRMVDIFRAEKDKPMKKLYWNNFLYFYFVTDFFNKSTPFGSAIKNDGLLTVEKKYLYKFYRDFLRFKKDLEGIKEKEELLKIQKSGNPFGKGLEANANSINNNSIANQKSNDTNPFSQSKISKIEPFPGSKINKTTKIEPSTEPKIRNIQPFSPSNTSKIEPFSKGKFELFNPSSTSKIEPFSKNKFELISQGDIEPFGEYKFSNIQPSSESEIELLNQSNINKIEPFSECKISNIPNSIFGLNNSNTSNIQPQPFSERKFFEIPKNSIFSANNSKAGSGQKKDEVKFEEDDKELFKYFYDVKNNVRDCLGLKFIEFILERNDFNLLHHFLDKKNSTTKNGDKNSCYCYCTQIASEENDVSYALCSVPKDANNKATECAFIVNSYQRNFDLDLLKMARLADERNTQEFLMKIFKETYAENFKFVEPFDDNNINSPYYYCLTAFDKINPNKLNEFDREFYYEVQIKKQELLKRKQNQNK